MQNLLFNKIIYWSHLNIKEQKKILSRPKIDISINISKIVNNILNDVQSQGDKALYFFNKKFDLYEKKKLIIDKDILLNSTFFVNKNLKNAIKFASKNINLFHSKQQLSLIDVEINPGIRCMQITRPIDSVGLYVPGGTAPLLSTVLMLAIPAQIAGCKNITLCSPPPISHAIIYAAKICGIKNIYQVGGAQAIAAMAFGTQSIKKVDKIFGPGNLWVTEAKRQVSQRNDGVTIDMIAGPTELLIVADNNSNPAFIASDLLSQAEHGSDSQLILITTNIKLINLVLIEINNQINILPRYEIIKKSLLKNSRFIIAKNIKECIKISNIYGPEHLIIQVENAEMYIKYIKNAGSVFIGPWSTESIGDYASGTNHVLPTSGHTLTCSGLSVIDFQKRILIQKINKEGLLKIAPIIEILSDAENMIAHKNSIKLRVDKIKE
ncbi:MAG: histidinol dehydrogenase [Enterobacterales bacterium]